MVAKSDLDAEKFFGISTTQIVFAADVDARYLPSSEKTALVMANSWTLLSTFKTLKSEEFINIKE
jgi:hypothetical protein